LFLTFTTNDNINPRATNNVESIKYSKAIFIETKLVSTDVGNLIVEFGKNIVISNLITNQKIVEKLNIKNSGFSVYSFIYVNEYNKTNKKDNKAIVSQLTK